MNTAVPRVSPLFAVLALVLTATACAWGTKIGAPSSRDRALLTSIVSDMKIDLASVRIGDPTREWQARPRPGRKFLYIRPAATSTIGKIADGWYANLIAGAYEAQC